MPDNHEKLYDILLSIKEDVGGIKSDVSTVKDQFKTLNGTVAKHSSFIWNLKGKLAIVTSAIAFTTSLITIWIKKQFFDD